MQKRLYAIFMIIVFSLVLNIFSCSSRKSTESVSFNPPGIYNGTYRAVEHWLSKDSNSLNDTVIFDFKSDGTFYMRVDTSVDEDRQVCNVMGTYRFYRDSLGLVISDSNVNMQICNQSAGPGGDFTHFIEGNYLIFEIRDTALYRRIELLGK